MGNIGACILIGHGEPVELVERLAVAFDGGAGGGGPRYAEAVGAHAGAAVNLALFGALVLFCVHATLLVGFVSFAWFSAEFSASSRCSALPAARAESNLFRTSILGNFG